MKVYLAGPISGLTYNEATAWRETAKSVLADYGAMGLSPFDQHNAPKDKNVALDAWFEEQIGMDTLTVVQGDLAMVDACDVLFMNLKGANRPSLGSMAELGYAWKGGKYVITVADPVHHNHPFVTHMSHETCEGLWSAVNALLAHQTRLVHPPYA